MTWSRRLPVLLVPALLATGVWWFAVWQSAAGDVAAAEASSEAARNTAMRLSSQLRTAERFTSGVDGGQAALDAQRTALPSTTDLGGFIALNAQAAQNAGVVVTALTPSAPGLVESSPGGTTAIGVDLEVTGPEMAAGAYLLGLQSLARTVVVDSISTSPAADMGGTQLALHIRIFQNGDPPVTDDTTSLGDGGTEALGGGSPELVDPAAEGGQTEDFGG